MKKPSPQYTVTIESLSHDGRGIATIQGKTSFLHGALPNEEIRCQLIKQHSRYNEGEVLEVLKSAPERTTPHCKHFTVCGGCSMQHIHDTDQINLKQNILLEQLLHFGKVTPENILAPITGNPWHYRRKARLGVRFVRKKNRVLVGFREKSTNYLTDIESCSVLHKTVGLKITALQELIQSLSQYDHIPQIEVSVSDTDTALIFRHMKDLSEDDLKKLRVFAEQHHFHLYLQPNAPAKLHKIWPPHSTENLNYRILLDKKELTFSFHPLDFIQVNGEINQLLLNQALTLLQLQEGDEVLDLFCGLGNFTLPMALYAKHVVGVEGSAEMVKRAEENARLNHISNVEFYASNLLEPSEHSPWVKRTYTKILLDPPRTGAKEMLPYLEKMVAKRICYVSCNPATLARDAGELVHQYGYQLKQLGVVNMFPHTSHIEAIALFEK